MSASAAVPFYQLLETGIKVPKGTSHIVVDEELCALLAKKMDLRQDLLVEVFGGLPVKEVRAISRWILGVPEEDRIGALRNWRRRRDARTGALEEAS